MERETETRAWGCPSWLAVVGPSISSRASALVCITPVTLVSPLGPGADPGQAGLGVTFKNGPTVKGSSVRDKCDHTQSYRPAPGYGVHARGPSPSRPVLDHFPPQLTAHGPCPFSKHEQPKEIWDLSLLHASSRGQPESLQGACWEVQRLGGLLPQAVLPTTGAARPQAARGPQ